MAYGGGSFTSTEALFFAGMEAYFRLGLNNIPIEEFYIPDSSHDSLKVKKQKDKHELRVSKVKKNNNEVKIIRTISEDETCATSETNQLSKRAKRRNRKNKIIESTSSLQLNKSQNIRKENDQTIKDQENNHNQSRKDEIIVSQKTGKEQSTIKAKKIVKEVVNKYKPKEKQKNTNSGKKSNNNCSKIKKEQKNAKPDKELWKTGSLNDFINSRSNDFSTHTNIAYSELLSDKNTSDNQSNNCNKIINQQKKNKADHIQSEIPQNQQERNKLRLHIPVDRSKICEFSNRVSIQRTNNDEYEHMKTEHSKNNPCQFINSLDYEPKVDLTFTELEEQDTDKEENGEWQTVGQKKQVRTEFYYLSRCASSSMSGKSTNDDELWEADSFTDLINAESNDYGFFTHTGAADSELLSDKNTSASQRNNYYSPTFACDNGSVTSYERRNMWPVIRSNSNADYSQLPVECEQKEEKEKIQSFVGNKNNWRNMKCKKKGKTKNVERLTLYPLSHVQPHGSDNKTPQSQIQNNQLDDFIKEGFWSLENVNIKHSFDTCNEQKNYVNDGIEVWDDNMATYDIPDRVLHGLKCGLCSEPLSYPPITLSSENGSVCGRCPTLETENNMQPLREDSYERVASMFNFPCRYTPQGCMEKLLMKNVTAHEQSCTFKPYFCPILPLGSCAWQGSSTELHGHFAISHQINLLENPVFELNIVSNYKELYLVPYLGQLFLLRTEFNCTDEIFRFSLHFVGSSESAEKYEYELVFLTPSEDAQWTHPKKPVDIDDNILDRKNECTVSLRSLTEILQVPTTITCRLKINVTQEGLSKESASINFVCSEENLYDVFLEGAVCEDEEDNDDDADDEEELDIKKSFTDDSVDKMMLDMECPVCQEVMIPPIYQCVVGHSVCDGCKPKLKECPTCRNTIANTRNFTLERISENLRYKCKNRIDGCTYETNSSGIRQHEVECKFNPHQCPLHNLLNCDWLGKSNKILSHVKTRHPDHFQDNSIFSVTYNASCLSNESMKIMRVHGEIFKIRFNYSNQMKQISCTVQFNGPSSEVCKFMYEMHVLDMNNTGLQLTSKKNCGALTDDIDDLKHSTMWHLDMVLPFASTDNLLKLRCVVTKV